MSGKHIKESNEGLRHFSRHTKPCTKTEGDCKYVDWQVTQFPKTGYGRHHILPVSSVGKFETFDGYSETDRAKIRDVYRETKWCTSREKNLIVLPLKPTYAKDLAARTLNLPCHDVDHGCARGYTDEVTVSVEVRIWRKFQKAVDGKGHPQAEEVAKALAALEDEFREKLATRGTRAGGTKAAAEALEAKSVDDIKKEHAWLPFSMAKDNVAKQRVLLSLGSTADDRLSVKLRSRYAKRS